MIRSLVLASAVMFTHVAQAGFFDDIMEYADNYDGAFNYDSDDEGDTTFRFSKEYNDCVEGARSKNDRDHDRCDKGDRGEQCHDKADTQYEKDRAGCERVSHSENARDTGVAWSGSGSDKADSNKGGGSNGGRSRGGRESGAGSRDSGR